ncbi:hypothetical protein N643_07355 [Salmonella bongori serovar 48:z41:-- str. RKS3044]|nr:hypothetical protein N643_07355 [Salmonella bongori serovar 48:z41:-- str. RKS3044]
MPATPASSSTLIGGIKSLREIATARLIRPAWLSTAPR